MRDLRGKTAVVTGGASGIGRAMAERFAAEGMRVVLADIEPAALEATAVALRAGGAEVLAVPTDVAQGAQVEALADRAVAAFGRVDVVCNNAGVAVSGPAWQHTVADWEWIIGVNLWGVIHGIRAFVPRMLAQGGPGHIVNTASVAGLTSNPMMGAYNVTKHAVVTLSETLHKDLDLVGASIKVSVLCPGFVQTQIADSDRNRPGALRNADEGPRAESMEQMVRQALLSGLPPAQVAADVLDAIHEERFYILTHPEFAPLIRERVEDILEGRVPSSRLTFG
ncbi:MAG TPA: SDR family NAD(P)-dependent oxidoreductase [Candidatus Binatia bacterium]|jgi:NAD(P)-dependent dehydrogenase (short-subunit alcohol dehydrogenase family)|nr:SDR family NAD(P)-dependent oxidoreductase [Candidatus Binatia bacterium]